MLDRRTLLKSLALGPFIPLLSRWDPTPELQPISVRTPHLDGTDTQGLSDVEICRRDLVRYDSCQLCYGEKGGEPGNENIYMQEPEHVLVCDYCHAELIKTGAILLHPYDAYAMFEDSKPWDLVRREPNWPDYMFKVLDGKLYWMTTAVPAKTRRIA
jgi:hypothetical protein